MTCAFIKQIVQKDTDDSLPSIRVHISSWFKVSCILKSIHLFDVLVISLRERGTMSNGLIDPRKDRRRRHSIERMRLDPPDNTPNHFTAIIPMRPLQDCLDEDPSLSFHKRVKTKKRSDRERAQKFYNENGHLPFHPHHVPIKHRYYGQEGFGVFDREPTPREMQLVLRDLGLQAEANFAARIIEEPKFNMPEFGTHSEWHSDGPKDGIWNSY